MSEVTSGKTHAHAIFTKRTERELAAVDNENVEATEDATVIKSFPIRRPDVLFSWWFFEGRECVPWNFPSGGCPANDSALFRTAHECRSRCLNGRQRDSQCLPPRVVACDISRIKYAFFADRSMSDGRMRCLRSSPDVLQYRRCLIRAKKFHTREACMATCKERRFK
ncbi:hypothetical protein HPB51_027900 [Rhipicephalus microplus]|uniref:Bovine pancreatic trypsin inhibitor n=1 Tax=Rhipicephalus microplus TaxID=6941 RepID=A0A9J6CYN8_RHIMP|nr:hypothetical protein HPB51_027900 [Rhipicephalus microplus]